MISCFLFIFLLTGLAYIFSRLFKVELTMGYFNAIPFAGLISFLGFIFSIPTVTAWLFFVGGTLGLLWFGYNYRLKKQGLYAFWVFLCLTFICILYAIGLQFRSIDDYSYWGVMSKYLFIFDSLPNNANYISASFLTYTPVIASFHYLLFTLANKYSIFLGYVAQGIVIIASWMVVIDATNTRRSLVNLSIWYIVFALGFGAFLARLEVDAYVAAYFFAITWVIYKKRLDAFFIIAIPMLFLSVIKEVGILFAFSALIMFAFLTKPKGKQLLYFLVLAIGIYMLKTLWSYHVTTLGFQSFAKAISVQNAFSALNPFNPWYHTAEILYAKEILLSNFDLIIRLPYLAYYILIYIMYFNLLKFFPENKSSYRTIFGGYFIIALIYLIMLYWLQAIVFAVGHDNFKILDFQRYYNMLFVPWLLISVFISLDAIKPKIFNHLLHPASIGIVLSALIILIFGKIERTHKLYNPNHVLEVYNIILKRTEHSDNKNWSLCIINPPDPEYQTMLPLTYFLMPHRVYNITPDMQKNYCAYTLNLKHRNV